MSVKGGKCVLGVPYCSLHPRVGVDGTRFRNHQSDCLQAQAPEGGFPNISTQIPSVDCFVSLANILTERILYYNVHYLNTLVSFLIRNH